EPLDPEQDGVADGGGQPEVAQGAMLPAVGRAVDVSPVDRLSEQLLEDEWVALRALGQETAGGGVDVLLEDRLQHPGDAGRVARLERDGLPQPRALPPLDVLEEGM